MLRVSLHLWFCYVMAMLCGCGGESMDLQDVSGAATFSGQPIAFGQLEFVPDAEKNFKAPAGYAEIVDGKYDTAAGGKGIVPGPYLVRVTGYGSRPTDAGTDETAATAGVEPLFVGFTLKMELKGGDTPIEVPPEAKGSSIYGDGRPAQRGGNEP